MKPVFDSKCLHTTDDVKEAGESSFSILRCVALYSASAQPPLAVCVPQQSKCKEIGA